MLTGNTHLPRVIKTSRFLLFLQTPQRNGTRRARGDSAGMATLSTSSGAVTEDRSKPSIKSTRQTLSKWSIKCSRQGTEFYSEFPEHNWLEQHKACRSPACASITSGLTGFCRGTGSSHVHLAYLKTQLKPGLMWHCSSHPASSRPSVCFHRPHHHPHKKIKQKKHFKPKETNVYLWGLNMVPVTSALGSGMLP